MHQVRKQYKALPFSWKFFFKVGLFVAFIYAFSFTVDRLKAVVYFPIKQVNIAGVEHVSRTDVQKLLLPLISNGFFSTDVGLIKERLKEFEWVSDASVKRVWPSELFVQLIEKKPLAQWNHGSFLTVSGEIFHPKDQAGSPHLPEFIGPDGNHMQMLAYYHKINTALTPLHLSVIKLELSRSLLWQVTLTNGIKLNLGYKNILGRINHFVRAYPKIVGERSSDVEYVDLRYSNGIAVRWKT